MAPGLVGGVGVLAKLRKPSGMATNKLGVVTEADAGNHSLRWLGLDGVWGWPSLSLWRGALHCEDVKVSRGVGVATA